MCKASKAWYQRLFDTLQNNGTIKDEWVETVLSSKAQQYNMERQCLVMVVTSNLSIICILWEKQNIRKQMAMSMTGTFHTP